MASLSALQLRKQNEIDELMRLGRTRVGRMDDSGFLLAGVALYAGEGTKGDWGSVRFANTDARMMALFCAWLRYFFEIDEKRMRANVYLHAGLDLDAAIAHWADATGVPISQFGKPFRPVSRGGKRAKHEFGCGYVSYACTRTHRSIMGLVSALLSPEAYVR